MKQTNRMKNECIEKKRKIWRQRNVKYKMMLNEDKWEFSNLNWISLVFLSLTNLFPVKLLSPMQLNITQCSSSSNLTYFSCQLPTSALVSAHSDLWTNGLANFILARHFAYHKEVVIKLISETFTEFDPHRVSDIFALYTRHGWA